MSSSSARARTDVTSADKPKTLQGRVKELLALVESGSLEQPFADHMHTMIKMVVFIHKELGKNTPFDKSYYTYINSISSDILMALNDLKTQIQQRIRFLNEIEKGLPNKKHDKGDTPTLASYPGSSDDALQWIEALE